MKNIIKIFIKMFGYEIKKINKTRYPIDYDKDFLNQFEAIEPFTMTSIERIYALKCAVKYIEDKVEQTLSENNPGEIALLRLDTDQYESTKIELEVLYPLLVSGGVLIIDDYGHFHGAKKAVDEYFKSIGEEPLMHRIDYSGRMIIKR